MTTATWAPLRTTSAICRATCATTSGSRPTCPPPNISPPSLSSTREYLGCLASATTDPPIRLLLAAFAIPAISEGRRHQSCLIAGARRRRGGVVSRLSEVGRQQPGGHRHAAVTLVPNVRAGKVLEAGEVLGDVGVDARVPNVVDDPILGHHVPKFLLGDGMGGVVGGHGGGVEDQYEVGRPRRGGAHDRLLIAVPQLDWHRVEES